MERQIEKEELVEWLSTVEDQNILDMVAEVRARYATPPDFDERLKNAMTSEEFKRRTTEYIKSLPWKK